MENREKKKLNIRPYFQALPTIFNYQIITKILIGIWIFLLGRIFQALLRSSGRVALFMWRSTSMPRSWSAETY